ncbi:hypothetical protein AVEN_14348-1 [Araneus ventricosus]|uniref:Uncharacterized protein n=1 Tax=Araneus ventricosus TaxID=182803 RepID=A0A4Y2WCN4_ARAVE|nr:hypothetical protein AVEN_14348-1 [Araneus ventricosus]
MNKFSSVNMTYKKADKDADCLIVKAIPLAPTHPSVVVMGEGIELFVILTWSSKSFLRRLPTLDVADRNSAKAICLRILLPCIAFSELKKRCAHAL